VRRREYLKDGYKFTPDKGWTRIADLPKAAVAAPSPAPLLGGNHFAVIGGDDGSKVGFEPVTSHPGFPREMLAYHTVTDTWTSRGEVAFASVVTAPAVSWQGKTA